MGVQDRPKPGPDGPDDEQCLRAWEMRVKGDSPAKIAETFGISVTSAKRWVKTGRELAEVTEYEAKVADPLRRIDLAAERDRQLATTDLVVSWMVDYVQRGGEEDKAAAIVLKALERRAAATGSDPPRRLAVRDDRAPVTGPRVDPRHAAAIERYQRGGDPVDEEGPDQ